MVSREQVKDPKKRILMVVVKMFIEKGYKETTMLDIIKEADVSASTFQNIFHTKDEVLLELIEFMFTNQFDMAKSIAIDLNNPVIIYAIETSIQLGMVESNEHFREISLEAYTHPKLVEFINQKTSSELAKIFAKYNPNWEESDFYEAEIGTSGIMRSFMAKPCNKYFTLKRKTERFLSMAFDVYHVPKNEQEKAIEFLKSINVKELVGKVLSKLFSKLEMTFEFKFSHLKEEKL